MIGLVAAGPAAGPGDLAARLAHVLNDPVLKGATIAAIVTDLDGRVLFAREANRRVTPASNQKLFTVAYALDRLGPEYRAETKFVRAGDEIRISCDGTLDLSYARLKAIADAIGPASRVLLRESYRRGWTESWDIGDAPNRYAPFVCAFSCEEAGMELWTKNGVPELRPAAFGATIAPRPKPGVVYDPFRAVVEVGPTGTAEKRIDTLSQPEPDVAAARLFGSDVRIVPTVDLSSGERTLSVSSASVAEVAPRCLQPSDNFLAESLYEMAKAAGLSPRDWAASRIGLTEIEYAPLDGSGLSRKDEVTVAGIAKLLRWSRNQSWWKVYNAALVRPGVGTLKSRLKDAPFAGKTGSLTGVSALSGYVEWVRSPARTPDTLIVSIIVNHYACPTARVHAIQDAFVRAVARS